MSLAQQVGGQLLARGESLALAESCTGGLIAKLCTDLSGSSQWFERGLVTYSNGAKQDLLGVPAAVLEQHGAVSQACALAMVQGLLHSSPAHWGVAVTGIAGPGGGSAEKPVGTVWLAWLQRGGLPQAELLRLEGGRDDIRQQAAAYALQGLLERLHA